MEDNQLTGAVIGAAVEVQKHLGPGLLEGTYAAALAHEMNVRGIGYQRELAIPVTYKGACLGLGLRADFVVEKQVVLELKAVEALLPVHRVQLLSYLPVSGHRIGLLINFHEMPVVRGVHRVIDVHQQP